MKRKKDIVIVCHCVINCNSKVEGLSLFEGALDFIKVLIDKGIGIIQLPCPELIVYGLKRWGHSKEQLDNSFFRNQCKEILKPYIIQFENYIKNGYNLKAIIAIDGSPSCGYNKTCSSSIFNGTLCEYPNSIIERENITMINEKGIFIEELSNLLKENNLDIPFLGLDEENLEHVPFILKNL